MTWISRVAPADQAPGLRATYERIRAHSSTQRVANLWLAWGADAAGLDATYATYRTLMDDPSPLTSAQARMVALVVSANNGCGYCVAHNGRKLARLLGEELAHDVARDYREANLTARDRVLLDCAVALNCEPAERTAADLERLREYGFDDAGVLRAVAIAAFYAYVNRVALALGVQLEDGVAPWEFGEQA